MQSILICGFYICEFINLLKFIHNPQINTFGVFMVIHGYVQSCKTFELHNVHVPS